MHSADAKSIASNTCAGSRRRKIFNQDINAQEIVLLVEDNLKQSIGPRGVERDVGEKNYLHWEIVETKDAKWNVKREWNVITSKSSNKFLKRNKKRR